MSQNPYPVFAISENDRPEQIEKRIRLLIRLYLAHHEQEIARAVVEHVNTILAHPQYICDVEMRCQFRRFSEHWRCLSLVDCYQAKNKTARPQSDLKLELKQILCM